VVSPEGGISLEDLIGVWSDEHFEPMERIARFIKAEAASPVFRSPTSDELP
jgi:hypothetical protein